MTTRNKNKKGKRRCHSLLNFLGNCDKNYNKKYVGLHVHEITFSNIRKTGFSMAEMC